MATLSTLVDHTIPVAADFNDNYEALNDEIRPVNRGGTAIATYTKGDLLYATGATTLAKLGIGVRGQLLHLASGLPAWGGLVLYKSGTPATTTNTTAATAVVNALSVPTPNSVARLRTTILATVTNTSGGAINYSYALQIDQGAGPITIDVNTVSVPNGSSGLPFPGHITMALATTRAWADLWVPFNAATSRIASSAVVVGATASTMTINMAMGTANANASFTVRHVQVELVL